MFETGGGFVEGFGFVAGCFVEGFGFVAEDFIDGGFITVCFVDFGLFEVGSFGFVATGLNAESFGGCKALVFGLFVAGVGGGGRGGEDSPVGLASAESPVGPAPTATSVGIAPADSPAETTSSESPD